MGEAARRKKLGLPPKEAPTHVFELRLLVPVEAIQEMRAQQEALGPRAQALTIRQYAEGLLAVGAAVTRAKISDMAQKQKEAEEQSRLVQEAGPADVARVAAAVQPFVGGGRV